MTTQIGYGECTARILLAGDSEEMNVTFGFEVVTPPFDQTKADLVSVEVGDFLQAIMSSAYSYMGARFSIGDASGDIIFDSIDGVGPGIQGPNATPQNTALLFRKTTASGGRRNRGRMFVPGLVEGSVGNTGVISTADAPAYQTAADELFDNLVTLECPMVILHPAVPGRPMKPATDALAAATPTPVTALQLQPVAATQRRRLR